MSDAVKVRYTGPGSKDDKRLMTVTRDEADRLVAGGYWKESSVPKVTKTTQKKEASNG